MIGVINKDPLEKIVEVVIKKASLITSMVLSIRPTSCFGRGSNLHLLSMKLVAVLWFYIISLIKTIAIRLFL